MADDVLVGHDPWTAAPRSFLTAPISAQAKVIGLLIASRASPDSPTPWPSQRLLADEAGVSVPTVKRAVAELRDAGFISVERQRIDGQLAGNLYTVDLKGSLVIPGPGITGDPSEVEPSLFKEDLVVQDHVGKKKNKASAEISPRASVQATWLSMPLMAHRESYFAEPKIKKLIDRAVAKYGVEDVQWAITSYARVVDSDKYFFNHRWPLEHFLTRGLDRFVPEAEPFKVFLKTADRMTRSERKQARIDSLTSGGTGI